MTCPSCQAPLSEGARFCGTCGKAFAATETQHEEHAGPAVAPELIGRVIVGRYRIIAKLGEGGMGAVFRAEQIALKRAVALKLLRPELSNNPALLRRFNAEAELVAKLSHPNTVNIYDFGPDTDGSLFIAMELIEGPSLRQVLRESGPLPPARALAIAAQLAASLTDAHAHGIIHRDLKPDNAMLQARGKEHDIVRVLDFGIAKLRDDTRATQMLTQAGDMIGTPQYMAPEQIRGEAIDGRTDVYALGCILYEMLTGRMPFEAINVMALLSKHLLEQPVPPSRRRPELGLSPALDELVLTAMAKVAGGRPPTMEAYGERIAAVLRGTAPATSPRAAAPWIPPMGYAGFDGHVPPPPEPLPPPTPLPPSIPMGYAGVNVTGGAAHSGLAAAARAAAGPTEMVDPLPRPALVRGPHGAMVTAMQPPARRGNPAVIVAVVAGLAVLTGIGVVMSRRGAATPAAARSSPVTPDPWMDDPWGHAHAEAPSAAGLPTREMAIPAGTELRPPRPAVQLFDTPGVQHWVDSSHVAEYVLAPLIGGTNDTEELAADWIRKNPTAHLDREDIAVSAGMPRPAVFFTTQLQTPQGRVPISQVLVIYIAPTYRMVLLIQAPLVSFRTDPTLYNQLVAFVRDGVIVPQ